MTANTIIPALRLRPSGVAPIRAFVQGGIGRHKKAHGALTQAVSDTHHRIAAKALLGIPSPILYGTVETATDTSRRLMFFLLLDLISKLPKI